jgi:hypothetical protein
MTTKPKLDDQTQAALSAIEEALKGSGGAEPRLPVASSDVVSVERRMAEPRARHASAQAARAAAPAPEPAPPPRPAPQPAAQPAPETKPAALAPTPRPPMTTAP